MWEARAEYADETSCELYFERNERYTENEDQYNIECILIERHPGCTWYSVNWMEV